MAITWATNGGWNVGPKPLVPTVNWREPLTRGLVFATDYSLNSALSAHRDLVTNAPGTYTGTALNADMYGFHRSFLGGTDVDSYATPSSANSPPKITVEFIFKANVSGTFMWPFAKGNGSGSIPAFFNLFYSDGADSIYVDIGCATTDAEWTDTNAVFGPNVYHHCVVTYDFASLANLPVIYKNGVAQPVSVVQAGVGAQIADTANLYIGNNNTGAFGASMDISYFRVWNRILSSQEVRALAQNPWQIYRQPPATIAVNTTSGTTHSSTGALTGPGSTIAGTAARFRAHPATGAITGPGSTIAGTSARFRAHAATGVLTGPGAAIVGSAARTGAVVIHACTGVLVGQGALIAGVSLRFGWTPVDPVSTTWNGTSPVSTNWAAATPASTSWSPTSPGSDPWTPVPGASTIWTPD